MHVLIDNAFALRDGSNTGNGKGGTGSGERGTGNQRLWSIRQRPTGQFSNDKYQGTNDHFCVKLKFGS